MSRGMGVVYYDTAEGGSGYIANSALPWLSSTEITQYAPVYDQETAWLRTEDPGRYTNYPRFGPPYSLDGGTQPPYAGMGAIGNPEPITITPGQPPVLTRSDVVAPMPSITDTANSGCALAVDTCSSEIGSWIQENPWLAAGLALAAGFVLFSDGGKKK